MAGLEVLDLEAGWSNDQLNRGAPDAEDVLNVLCNH